MKRQTWISMHGKKRINPKTGKLFTTGDVRDDGYIFVRYNKRLKLNGFFAEQWRPQVLDGKKRINPNTGQPFKYGDYDPEMPLGDLLAILKSMSQKKVYLKKLGVRPPIRDGLLQVKSEIIQIQIHHSSEAIGIQIIQN